MTDLKILSPPEKKVVSNRKTKNLTGDKRMDYILSKWPKRTRDEFMIIKNLPTRWTPQQEKERIKLEFKVLSSSLNRIKQLIPNSTVQDCLLVKDYILDKKFKPQNEQGVVFLFGRYYDLYFDKIIEIRSAYPDIIALYQQTPIRIEVELYSSNFILHRHNPKDCDLVICWQVDKDLSLPIWALDNYGEFPTKRLKKRLERNNTK